MNRIYKRFEELDVCGKVTFKSKIREFAFPDETSMCPPPTKVKTKGAPKKVMKRSKRLTKRDPSYWEYVDAYHLVQNNNTSVRPSASSCEPPKPARMISMLNQFAPFMHGFIEDVVDVKANGNYGYRSVSALLGMGKECWAVMRNKLIKELGKWSQDYIKIFGGMERYEQLRLSLHVDGLSKKLTIGRFFYALHDMRRSCVWQSFYSGLSERSLSLTVYGIVVVKQFVSRGKIVANCICRTPDAILNLLERPSIPTHDAVLYYNGRWNMPRQNNFVGNAFTGINPPKFDIPKGCTIDELKDLIKQVAPKGNPPHGIHESQLVRRLFYRQPAHLEYSDKVLKFEIIELKSDDDVLKVLVESNYWKQFVPIEILALFSKVVLENDDKVVTSLHV
ncbi:hypothetical protein GmHk_04G010785 [Glycine max]|nr:hypothetical protein GmHk_04G010785 [Glycine max]KAH1254322.1 hypothetical protein GmHk_04G010785 [Glycine max]